MNRSMGIVAVVLIASLGAAVLVISGKLTAARKENSRLQTALHTRQTPAGQVQAAAMMVGILRPVSNVTVRAPGEPVMAAPAAVLPAPAPAAAPAATPAGDATNAVPESDSNTVSAAAAPGVPATGVERPIPESDLAAAIQQMSDAWKLRRIELENSTIATIGLNGEQAEAFRQITEYMNRTMGEKVHLWTNRLQSASTKVTEESCVRVINELSGYILLTYTEMDRRLGPGWRSKVPRNFTVTDFIDPGIGVPMVEAQRLLREKR